MDKPFFDLQSEFGCDLFTKKAMRQFLSKEAYEALLAKMEDGTPLEGKLANEVADGMRRWAISRGATHFTHWFQPLNGLTAEKHEAFISGEDKDGKAIISFSGKELIKGEGDASSLPSGGLRATFEARGYTAWDTSSPAFVIHDDYGAVLYIPTAFCSYTKEALDEKTPLLRSQDYVNEQAKKALSLLGIETKKVIAYAGAEQEYFLVDSANFQRRKDLAYTGRTLFGAPSPKGQELEDHYFGPIREKVSSFMAEVNKVLWRLGVMAKTEHNEVAPSQHELACIYSPTNIAADQNQLVMMVLRRMAKKQGLVCLLEEKPFDGINGSGKHVNYSLGTEEGLNLFKMQKNGDNLPFFLFLTAMVAGADEYAPAFRLSASSYGNDFRLGGHEAPPAILSVFLGEELEKALDDLEHGSLPSKKEIIDTGAKSLPLLYKDTIDRNRTSPLAFTGNKFEFRMVGSNQNISGAATVLNTAVGKKLEEAYEAAKDAADKRSAIIAWIKKEMNAHRRIVYSGDGYSVSWAKEAQARGLMNIPTTIDAIQAVNESGAKSLYTLTGVLSESELRSRAEISYGAYSSRALIEAKTMSHIANKLLLPAANRYLSSLLAEEKDALQCKELLPSFALDRIRRIKELMDEASKALLMLEKDIDEASHIKGMQLALFAKSSLVEDMRKLRAPLDALELIVDKSYWPIPSYGDLLFHTI